MFYFRVLDLSFAFAEAIDLGRMAQALVASAPCASVPGRPELTVVTVSSRRRGLPAGCHGLLAGRPRPAWASPRGSCVTAAEIHFLAVTLHFPVGPERKQLGL